MFPAAAVTQGTVLTDLPADDVDFQSVAEQMQSTIQEHKDNAGGIFDRYNIVKVDVLTQAMFHQDGHHHLVNNAR